MIYNISPNASAQTGLQKGDVIVQIGNRPIGSAQDVARVIDASRNGYLQVVVERQGQYLQTMFGIR